MVVTLPWGVCAGMKELAALHKQTLKSEVIAAFRRHFEHHDYRPPRHD